MDFESKVALAHAEAQSKGIWESNYNPPIYRLIRWIGIQTAPPYYQSFYFNFILSFCYFTPLMWLFSYFINDLSLSESGIGAVVTGVAFALLISVVYRIRQSQLKLTKWENL